MICALDNDEVRLPARCLKQLSERGRASDRHRGIRGAVSDQERRILRIDLIATPRPFCRGDAVLPKQGVAGSTPVSRSKQLLPDGEEQKTVSRRSSAPTPDRDETIIRRLCGTTKLGSVPAYQIRNAHDLIFVPHGFPELVRLFRVSGPFAGSG